MFHWPRKYLVMQSAKDRGCPGFENAEGTIEICIRIDKLFDILNNVYRPDNLFKSPVTRETYTEVMAFLNETADYIKRLKMEPNQRPLVYSERKMGFKGMLVNIENFKTIYINYEQTDCKHSRSGEFVNVHSKVCLVGVDRIRFLVGIQIQRFCNSIQVCKKYW